MAQIQELIALLEKSGDAKTKIIDKQSEMITFLKSHIQTLGILLDEYDDIVQKYINQKRVKKEIEIDQEEFSGKGEPPTTKRWLSSFSPFISLFRSPFSFHLPYESHLRLREVYLHAPHDRRLRRRPPAPGR